MRFKDKYTNKDLRFSVGVEEESGRYYISVPVSNQMVDYEEYYEIDEDTFNCCPKSLDKLKLLVEKCRNNELDEALFFKPGTDRGVK